MRMKRVFIFAALFLSGFLPGCTDPLEKRSSEEVQGQIERGVTGQGRIGEENRAPDDPANEHAVPETHP
jgi:hypothetical protein